jgi:hypothetical protein
VSVKLFALTATLQVPASWYVFYYSPVATGDKNPGMFVERPTFVSESSKLCEMKRKI